MTSPYKFYQFWLNVADDDLSHLLRVFSLKNQEEIEALEKLPNPNEAKRALAEELTTRIHSAEDFENARDASSILFGNAALEKIQQIDEQTLLEVFEGLPQRTISRSDYEATTNVIDLLSETTQQLVFKSKGEARRMIQQGGVSINKEKIASAEAEVNFSLLQNKYLLVQRGKKNHFLVRVEE